jgi:hypothetical protein
LSFYILITGCTKYGFGVVGSPGLIRGGEKEDKEECEGYQSVFYYTIKLIKLD